MRTLLITTLSILTLFAGDVSAQKQQPVVIYAIDAKENDGILDTVSTDWRLCQYAIDNKLHYRLVYVSVTNWPKKESSFEDRKNIYVISLGSLEIERQ